VGINSHVVILFNNTDPRIIAHELGHAMGLDEYMNDIKSNQSQEKSPNLMGYDIEEGFGLTRWQIEKILKSVREE